MKRDTQKGLFDEMAEALRGFAFQQGVGVRGVVRTLVMQSQAKKLIERYDKLKAKKGNE